MLKGFKNEIKTSKTEEEKSNVSTSTKTNGSSISKSVVQSRSYTSASHATTTLITQNTLVGSSNGSNIIPSLNTKTRLDKNTYRGAPARSAFTSTPLTKKSSSVYDRKTSTDAKPFYATPSNQNVTTLQNNLLHVNAASNSNGASELKGKLQIKVQKSTAFFDNPKSVVPVYKTRSKNRGRLLLINNIEFVNGKEIRKGAKLDESNVCALFTQIGFEVIPHRNLNRKGVQSKVTAFRTDKTLSKFDIAAVIIMSHGTGRERSDSTEIACTDGELLPATWIINEFDSTNCPQLDGKPKIFIFQCCRGEQWDIQTDGIPTTITRKLCDMLIAYATLPGFVAHRDPENGTWYIQAICKVFMDHAHDTDVESLLKIVDSKLSYLITNHGSKQTTSFENRGFKTCYLHPQLYEK